MKNKIIKEAILVLSDNSEVHILFDDNGEVTVTGLDYPEEQEIIEQSLSQVLEVENILEDLTDEHELSILGTANSKKRMS